MIRMTIESPVLGSLYPGYPKEGYGLKGLVWCPYTLSVEVPEPYQHGPEVELPTTFRQGDGQLKWGRDLRFTSINLEWEFDPHTRPVW